MVSKFSLPFLMGANLKPTSPVNQMMPNNMLSNFHQVGAISQLLFATYCWIIQNLLLDTMFWGMHLHLWHDMALLKVGGREAVWNVLEAVTIRPWWGEGEWRSLPEGATCNWRGGWPREICTGIFYERLVIVRIKCKKNFVNVVLPYFDRRVFDHFFFLYHLFFHAKKPFCLSVTLLKCLLSKLFLRKFKTWAYPFSKMRYQQAYTNPRCISGNTLTLWFCHKSTLWTTHISPSDLL